MPHVVTKRSRSAVWPPCDTVVYCSHRVVTRGVAGVMVPGVMAVWPYQAPWWTYPGTPPTTHPCSRTVVSTIKTVKNILKREPNLRILTKLRKSWKSHKFMKKSWFSSSNGDVMFRVTCLTWLWPDSEMMSTFWPFLTTSAARVIEQWRPIWIVFEKCSQKRCLRTNRLMTVLSVLSISDLIVTSLCQFWLFCLSVDTFAALCKTELILLEIKHGI